MHPSDDTESARTFVHDARQSLNAIRLTTGNLRHRLPAQLAEEGAAYLLAKLEKIDRQVDRLADLLDGVPRATPPHEAG